MAPFVIWLPPVGTFGIVLAVAGFIVSILGFKGWLRVGLATACFLLGVGEVLSIIRADNEHAIEIAQQHSDVENLRGDLRRSETEREVSEAYLKAKLEDSYQMEAQLAQFGPAIMKLAQTSADFQRKQYEEKNTSGKELHDSTMALVKKIREFSEKYNLLEERQITEQQQLTRAAPSEVERNRIWDEQTQKRIQLYYARESEFRNSILPDALYAKTELEKKKIPEPALGPIEKSEVNLELHGVSTGMRGEQALANYLELMARQLPSK